jgi:hypothetical protein
VALHDISVGAGGLQAALGYRNPPVFSVGRVAPSLLSGNNCTPEN